MKFKIGDKVTAFGLIGEVTRVHLDVDSPYIVIEWDNSELVEDFMPDGKKEEWHKEISLVPIK